MINLDDAIDAMLQSGCFSVVKKKNECKGCGTPPTVILTDGEKDYKISQRSGAYGKIMVKDKTGKVLKIILLDDFQTIINEKIDSVS